MTIERVSELKLLYQEEVNYYGNLDFTNLQGKFQSLLEILAEIEEVIRERDNLKARVEEFERAEVERIEQLKYNLDGEVID
jgi:uncharacterized protein YqgV (UPF0045/DUF77 family)